MKLPIHPKTSTVRSIVVIDSRFNINQSILIELAPDISHWINLEES